jgi:hypothetical protein
VISDNCEYASTVPAPIPPPPPPINFQQQQQQQQSSASVSAQHKLQRPLQASLATKLHRALRNFSTTQ